MPIKFFCVPATLPGEAEAELNRFLGGHQVVSIDRHLGSANGAPVWCFAIEYIVPAYGVRDTNAANPGMRKDRIDYKEVLPPDVFARFSKLRELRKQIAESGRVPIDAVFTTAVRRAHAA
ncbi:MAG: hypothetical protein IPK26_27700 [Planctomycetes bacterium]|nr:hypothetical protein [Planctomycetota bacterium]